MIPVQAEAGTTQALSERMLSEEWIAWQRGLHLTDASSTVVATYAYDEFGVPTSSSETLPNGWTNPYRYDGRDGVRYDSETGLYWMSVRAYAPSVCRFIALDPLGRAPLCFADQPYAYAGNNPLTNVDPSGQWRQMLDG